MATAEITPSLDLSAEYEHALLPEASHDEFARQEFVKSFKLHVATQIAPGNKTIYERRALPAFEREHGRAPKDRHEVRSLMKSDAYYQFWSELLRTSQEMMWESVGSSVERQLPELISKARDARSEHGSLRLDPDLEVPAYHRAVDIHCQPGGYHTELTEDDVAAGAVYDRAVYVYAMGRMGPFNDDIGASLAHHIRREFPDFAPRRILDLGCSVGHSTVPYAEVFPGAEIHAVEVGAPMLRYGHARAESLGVPIHFSQQNAESMDFEDGSFDLVVSHILLHETSAKAIRRIMAECQRLLRPGGLMLHGEVPQYSMMPAFDAFMLDWDTYNNNEPFWGTVHDMDLEALAVAVGFEKDKVVQMFAPSAFAAAEAKRTHTFQGGDFGGGGQWFAFGAWR
jgi:ubiquinone/menaquinone biosynthesis C-methylase UbiE